MYKVMSRLIGPIFSPLNSSLEPDSCPSLLMSHPSAGQALPGPILQMYKAFAFFRI